jgi:hypothetical protein
MSINKQVFAFLFAVFLGSLSPVQVYANSNAPIERIVRGAFSDIPEMISIARCESGFRQFNADGSVLKASGRYLGIFQIDERIHTEKALGMGFDIKTVEGNIGYARHLHSVSGTNPWKGCISAPSAPVQSPALVPNPAQSPAPSLVSGAALTANMNMGMSNPQVLMLQQILNRLGFAVSPTGPGSPGQETSYFGSLTREAVKRFQCSKNITCSGDESSTGYGRVGPLTRASLNQVSN